MKNTTLTLFIIIVGFITNGSELYFTLGLDAEGEGLVKVNDVKLSPEKFDLVLQRMADLNPDQRFAVVVEPEVSAGFTAKCVSQISAKGLNHFKIIVYTELPEGFGDFEGKIEIVIKNSEDLPEPTEFDRGEPAAGENASRPTP